MPRTLPRTLLAAILAAGVVLAGAPAASADTNPERTLAVDVLERSVRLTAGGAVVVPLRARCAPHLDAFELDVGVVQGTRSGSTNTLGGAFPACDGQWHRTAVKVRADYGRFSKGWVRIGVYLGAYDTVEDHDTEATDTVRVWLRPPSYA
jgi:hypothetical protein